MLATEHVMNDVEPPTRTLVQRMEALDRANHIRITRAQFKRDLAAGRVVAYDYILEPPEWLHGMKLFDLILAMPKYGRVKVNKIHVTARISPSKTVGGLSVRQRAEVVSMLRR